jgi:hypothetical protein
MNHFRLVFGAFLFVVMTSTFSLAVQAQAQRTYVSGMGDDADPCSLTAPCKTFAGAISKTMLGGEIDVLNTGGFGQVTIVKSITIDGTGALAGILATGSPTGILINITDATDTAKAVRIRGLALNGGGSAGNGINVMAANKVTVEDSVIDGFTANGINVVAGVVFVRNTTIRNNAKAGINVGPSGAQVGMTDVSLIFNGTGVTSPAGSVVFFNNVVFYGNSGGDPARPATAPK